MIAPQQRDMAGVFQLQAEQQAQCFNRIMTPIYKISQENIGRLRRPAAYLEKVQEIKELAMQVTDDSDRTGNRLDIAFLHEKFRNIRTQLFERPFRYQFA